MLQLLRRSRTSSGAPEHTVGRAEGHPGRAKIRFAQLFVVALMGAALPALAATPAQAASCATPRFDPFGRALPAGTYVCGYSPAYQTYDSRGHLFVVGTNSSNSIYHTFQTSVGGPYSAWSPLGGTGRSKVGTRPYNSSQGLALEIWVVGLNNVKYCKNYNGNINGRWWPSSTAWTSNPSSCLSF